MRANRIGDGGIKALSVALATDGTAPRLETLNLSSNMAPAPSLGEASHALAVVERVVVLMALLAVEVVVE